jgi:hypothetical protein
MSYLYLQTADSLGIKEMHTLFEKDDVRRSIIDEAITKASTVLTDAGIDHVLFKTIRPYPSTTVDIDTLIMNAASYEKSIDSMRKSGYTLVARGPKSTTMWDEKADIGIDLYEEIAVSYTVYLDKQTLAHFKTSRQMTNDRKVRMLKPEADLVCIIAHSVIKEQMYTLAEYFSYIHYLKHLDVSDFVRIIEENHITNAAKTHTAITAMLHRVAHQSVPKQLSKIITSIGKEDLEISRIAKSGYETPHKYHPITIARSLTEIMKGTKSRNSIASQLIHMLSPQISQDFLRKLTNHFLRETY